MIIFFWRITIGVLLNNILAFPSLVMAMDSDPVFEAQKAHISLFSLKIVGSKTFRLDEPLVTSKYEKFLLTNVSFRVMRHVLSRGFFGSSKTGSLFSAIT